MNDSLIKQMEAETQQLRTLVVHLSATLLRTVAAELDVRRSFVSADAERLVREAEDCFRCARIPGLKVQIAEGLEVAGHELMAKAVEIESGIQRDDRTT